MLFRRFPFVQREFARQIRQYSIKEPTLSPFLLLETLKSLVRTPNPLRNEITRIGSELNLPTDNISHLVSSICISNTVSDIKLAISILESIENNNSSFLALFTHCLDLGRTAEAFQCWKHMATTHFYPETSKTEILVGLLAYENHLDELTFVLGHSPTITENMLIFSAEPYFLSGSQLDNYSFFLRQFLESNQQYSSLNPSPSQISNSNKLPSPDSVSRVLHAMFRARIRRNLSMNQPLSSEILAMKEMFSLIRTYHSQYFHSHPITPDELHTLPSNLVLGMMLQGEIDLIQHFSSRDPPVDALSTRMNLISKKFSFPFSPPSLLDSTISSTEHNLPTSGLPPNISHSISTTTPSTTSASSSSSSYFSSSSFPLLFNSPYDKRSNYFNADVLDHFYFSPPPLTPTQFREHQQFFRDEEDDDENDEDDDEEDDEDEEDEEEEEDDDDEDDDDDDRNIQDVKDRNQDGELNHNKNKLRFPSSSSSSSLSKKNKHIPPVFNSSSSNSTSPSLSTSTSSPSSSSSSSTSSSSILSSSLSNFSSYLKEGRKGRRKQQHLTQKEVNEEDSEDDDEDDSNDDDDDDESDEEEDNEIKKEMKINHEYYQEHQMRRFLQDRKIFKQRKESFESVELLIKFYENSFLSPYHKQVIFPFLQEDRFLHEMKSSIFHSLSLESSSSSSKNKNKNKKMNQKKNKKENSKEESDLENQLNSLLLFDESPFPSAFSNSSPFPPLLYDITYQLSKTNSHVTSSSSFSSPPSSPPSSSSLSSSSILLFHRDLFPEDWNREKKYLTHQMKLHSHLFQHRRLELEEEDDDDDDDYEGEDDDNFEVRNGFGAGVNDDEEEEDEDGQYFDARNNDDEDEDEDDEVWTEENDDEEDDDDDDDNTDEEDHTEKNKEKNQMNDDHNNEEVDLFNLSNMNEKLMNFQKGKHGNNNHYRRHRRDGKKKENQERKRLMNFSKQKKNKFMNQQKTQKEIENQDPKIDEMKEEKNNSIEDHHSKIVDETKEEEEGNNNNNNNSNNKNMNTSISSSNNKEQQSKRGGRKGIGRSLKAEKELSSLNRILDRLLKDEEEKESSQNNNDHNNNNHHPLQPSSSSSSSHLGRFQRKRSSSFLQPTSSSIPTTITPIIPTSTSLSSSSSPLIPTTTTNDFEVNEAEDDDDEEQEEGEEEEEEQEPNSEFEYLSREFRDSNILSGRSKLPSSFEFSDITGYYCPSPSSMIKKEIHSSSSSISTSLSSIQETGPKGGGRSRGGGGGEGRSRSEGEGVKERGRKKHNSSLFATVGIASSSSQMKERDIRILPSLFQFKPPSYSSSTSSSSQFTMKKQSKNQQPQQQLRKHENKKRKSKKDYSTLLALDDEEEEDEENEDEEEANLRHFGDKGFDYLDEFDIDDEELDEFATDPVSDTYQHVEKGYQHLLKYHCKKDSKSTSQSFKFPSLIKRYHEIQNIDKDSPSNFK